MATLIDTNILLYFLDGSLPLAAWCDRQLETSRRYCGLVVNPIIYAELAAGFPTGELLGSVVDSRHFVREDLPWEATFLAGQAFRTYRRSGDEKRSPLPDFYIGAHAVVRAHRLLTRDTARYRTYFPSVEVISPETHP